MSQEVCQHVFIVDDDMEVCRILARTVSSLGVEVSCFTGAKECLDALQGQRCDLLISDVRMPEMDGMALLEEVQKTAPWLAVLLITGYGEISQAVEAVKRGARDYIEKPLDRVVFLQKVKSLLREAAGSRRGCRLTDAELRVLKLVARGMTNREIAKVLKRSVRTVEDHRRHIREKLKVHNVVQLIGRARKMGLIDGP